MSKQGTYELCLCTKVLVNEITMPETTRDDIALTYAMAITSTWKTDWFTVNAAIIDRWSRAALKYIKARAWKLVKKRQGCQDDVVRKV